MQRGTRGRTWAGAPNADVDAAPKAPAAGWPKAGAGVAVAPKPPNAPPPPPPNPNDIATVFACNLWRRRTSGGDHSQLPEECRAQTRDHARQPEVGARNLTHADAGRELEIFWIHVQLRGKPSRRRLGEKKCPSVVATICLCCSVGASLPALVCAVGHRIA
jgi:hypothetical protein